MTPKRYRMVAVVFLIILALALLYFGTSGHNLCSDEHCVVCRFLRPLMELLPMAMLLGSALLVPLLSMHTRLSASVVPLCGTTPVKQKIKLTI